jgi:hypothetical protein
MNNTPAPQQSVTFSAFLPVTIMALALGVILVWTLVVSVYDCTAVNRQRDQLVAAQYQAINVEQKVKSLMEGLLTLAETDPDAKAIAEKYQIRFNAPAGGAQPLTPARTGTPTSSTTPSVKRPPLPAVTSAVTEARSPAESAKDN